MDKAIQSLYRELLKEACEYGVSCSVLSRFHKRMEKAKYGKMDSSKIVIPLIREIEKSILRNTRVRDKESALTSMARKRTRFSELQKEMTYRGK